jgi:hypothetical protein
VLTKQCSPLKPHLQSIVLWLFWRWGLKNYFLGLASNLDATDLSLPSSYDYRREPPVPGYMWLFY